MSRSIWKSSMLAAALLPALAQAADAPGRYIIKFKDGKTNGRAAVEAAGGKVHLDLHRQNAVAATLPEAALKGLQASGQIEYAEVDQPRMPFAQQTPYGVPMVQADQVWPSATGAGRKVCIIDSGFYINHEDLQKTNVTGYPAGWDTDSCGHGSHVAGTIAALNNSAGVVGVLPNGVNLHIIKVFGDDCSWTYSSSLVDALNRCVDAGSNVVSMSLGGGRASNTERNAFDSAWSKGVLSIAAAGNDGTSALSYPASYASVVSVGALDSNKTIASFSQFNAEVDIAAPGVGVLSTVDEKQENSVTTSDGTLVNGSHIEFSARTSGVSGALVDGGICDSVGAWGGKVVLCQRGTISFFDKVKNVQTGGGVAAIIYNNVSGGFAGTLGEGNTSTIPGLTLSQEDGQALVASKLGQTSKVVSLVEKPASGYAYYDGTSMATPHVSAVAALVWSYNTGWTNTQVRDALERTAQDLGAAGRDDYYGHGLIQARAALDYLTGNGGGGGGDTTAPTTSITAPTGGSTVSGTVTYSADAADAVGVTKVEFYVGSSLLATDTSSPFSTAWDTTQSANATYTLTTKAYDAAGNVGTSSAVSVNVSNSTSSCATTEQILLNPGFESGNVNWLADSGVITSSTNARSGSYLAWLNGYGKSNTDFAYQDITIPAGACSATFKYWLKVSSAETTTTAAYDKLTVTVRNTSNSVLATLASYSNLNKSADYAEFSFDLKAYAGQTIRLYFYGTEDRSNATSFFVDDTSLSITK